MYQGSPRTSITDMRGIMHHSPQKMHHRTSPAPNQILSPTHRRTQGSGASSPMTIGDTMYFNPPSQNHSVYHDHGRTSPIPANSSRTTPFQSPSHSRSTSMTGMKNLMRDRSSERMGQSDYIPAQGGPLVRDRSLDRQLDRHAYVQRKDSRDRSTDRDFLKHMESGYPRVRHGSLDTELFLDSSSPTPSLQSQLTNDIPTPSVIMDYRSDMASLNSECGKLQQELELCKEKLSSTMNSIKTFWSPELKKERALRKEESSRYSLLNEQLRTLSSEKQQLSATISNLEDQLRASSSSLSKHNNHFDGSPALRGADEVEKLRLEREKQSKELVILHKTVEELELRVDTQKQTLGARNESIKKLLEMLQSKGLPVKKIEEDIAEVERFQNRAYEEEKRRRELETALRRKDEDMKKLKEQIDNLRRHIGSQPAVTVNGGTHNDRENTNLQSVIEAKDAKICRLEGDVRLLEEELIRLREDGLVTPRERADDKQVQALKSRERLLKGKIDNILAEMSRKDSELCGLQTKLETSEKQGVDQQHYIAVLKEQIKAKEQRASIQQSDMELLRNRLQDKELTLEKKTKALNAFQSEKGEIEAEVRQLQDQVDVKDRKVSVLQRKIDHLEDSVADKDSQLTVAKTHINSMNTDQSSSDSALSSLEDSLNDKERQIERLKEQRDRLERENQEEMAYHSKTVQELKTKIERFQEELNEKQATLFELRDEVSDIRACKLKKESECNQLELQVSYKNDEILELTEDINKLKEELHAQNSTQESDQRISELESQISQLNETIGKSHQEVDRLLTILKEMENEKHEKDNQIKELNEQVKEYKQKQGTLKRSQQMEKKKSAELLEDARKREEDTAEGTEQMKTVLDQKRKRVEELEEALRESVRITAERELLIAEQQHMLEESELKIRQSLEERNRIAEQFDEIDHIECKTREQNETMHEMSRKMEENERKLRKLQEERKRHLEEVFEMKQEAILAAITEKDATIAVLEMSTTNTAKAAGEVDQLVKEKQKLQLKLKEVTQQQMKLMQQKEGTPERNNSVNKDQKAIDRLKHASTEQVIQSIRRVYHNRKKLMAFLDQLVAVCMEKHVQLLEGLPRTQQNAIMSNEQLRRMPHDRLVGELLQQRRDITVLQDYVNVLIQRMRTHCPDRLDRVMNVLENRSFQPR